MLPSLPPVIKIISLLVSLLEELVVVESVPGVVDIEELGDCEVVVDDEDDTVVDVVDEGC